MWLSTEFVNNLVAVLNVLASQVATALDTLNISSDRSCTPTRTRTRPVDTSSTWCTNRLPPPRPLAPNAARNDRAPGHASSTTPDSDSDGSVRPHPGASSFRPWPTVVHGPRELLQEFIISLRNAHLELFTAWTQGELDEMARRKKDKDSYKTIARFLQKPIEEVKQAWKVYQRLEARG